MKIRRELNRQLYRQKAYGYEKRPYYFDEPVFNAILNGDIEKLKILISSGSVTLSAGMRILSKNHIKNMKYHFMIMATCLAESGLDGGLGHDEAYMIADIYSQKADRAAGCDDLQMLLEDMCLDYTKRIREIKKDDVISIHIRKCIEHIYEDLSADLSTKALADLTNLNASYLSKLFKQETGRTIKAYVTAAKMDTAQNLLKYSDLSCSEIATSLGYCSQSAFTYAFRQFTGTTPKKYRG
ncbi:MAG: helix-turn-helix transcriptional regulator [Lachnospiraceae bacterium]|nr:helix-turn-helix transcriptional regulator [Lachnospiraceae bacterium]